MRFDAALSFYFLNNFSKNNQSVRVGFLRFSVLRELFQVPVRRLQVWNVSQSCRVVEGADLPIRSCQGWKIIADCLCRGQQF